MRNFTLFSKIGKLLLSLFLFIAPLSMVAETSQITVMFNYVDMTEAPSEAVIATKCTPKPGRAFGAGITYKVFQKLVIGDKYTFTFTPAAGYKIQKITYNNQEVVDQNSMEVTVVKFDRTNPATKMQVYVIKDAGSVEEKVKVSIPMKKDGNRLRFMVPDNYAAYEVEVLKGTEITLMSDIEQTGKYELSKVRLNGGANIYTGQHHIKFIANENTVVTTEYKEKVMPTIFSFYLDPNETAGTFTLKDFNGEITRNNNTEFTAQLIDGKEYEMTVTANEGYEIESFQLQSDTKPIKVSDNEKKTMTRRFTPDAAMRMNYLTVKFKKAVKKYSVSAVTTGNFSMMVTTTLEGLDNADKVVENGKATVKVQPNGFNTELTILVNHKVIEGPFMQSMDGAYTREVTITENTVIEVKAEQGVSITYDAKEDQHGKVEFVGAMVAERLINFAHGSEVVVKTTPDAGYVLESIKIKPLGSKEFIDITEAKKFTATENEYEVVVTFAKEKQSITLPDAVEGGSLDFPETKERTQAFEIGSSITLKLNLNEGYDLVSIKHNGKDISDSKTFVVVKGENKIEVEFKKYKDTAVEGLDNTSVRVYPNPAVDFAIVEGLAPMTEVYVINVLGQKVMKAQANAQGKARLTVKQLAKGLYIIRSAKTTLKLTVK